jgi:23S rRNA pseudouridine2605 synthase
MKERIQKILGNAGVSSRRAVEEMVRQGRIAINGRVMTELPILVNAEKDKIEVDGETVRFKGRKSAARVYVLMNKPRGVYTTNVAQGAQTRAIDLLPPDFAARVYPVGRLDAESKGLLLLTNDGDLTNRLTHPRYGVPKTYRAVIDGFVDPKTIQELEKGVWMADKSGQGFKTGRSHIKIAKRSRDRSTLEITIREGRNRQVRRMLANLGHKVRDLTRIKMGPLTLKGLALGQSRLLTPREIRELQDATRPKKLAPGKGDASTDIEKERDDD